MCWFYCGVYPFTREVSVVGCLQITMVTVADKLYLIVNKYIANQLQCIVYSPLWTTCIIVRTSSKNPCDIAVIKSDVTHRDHVSVAMDPLNVVGSRIVNFIVNFIRNGTVFA